MTNGVEMTSALRISSARSSGGRLFAAFGILALIGAAGPAWTQNATTGSAMLTSGSATAEAGSSTSAAAKKTGDSGASDNDTTYSIVLAGEKVGLDAESPKKNLPDMVGATTSTLGTDVSDFTKFGLTLADTAKQIKDAPDINPDIAIIFGGYTDEKNDVPEDQVKAAIKSIATSLKSRNPEMRIFLVPAATYMGTLMSARMRLSAEENDMTFVPLGTEVSGEPFAQAMLAVSAELNKPKASAAPQAPAQPAHAVTIRGGQIDKAAPAPADDASPVSYEQKQASLQRELNRIAGDASDEPPLPDAADALSTSSFIDGQSTAPAVAGETPLPPGGKVTVQGKDAQEEIQMRPLPALKAYRPQIPVPRNEIDKKEPALSR